MASTSCFLHQSTARLAASARPAPAVGRTQLLVCKAQKNDEAAPDAVVTSRRAALSLLAGAAAVAVKVSPAAAAYGESGKHERALIQTRLSRRSLAGCMNLDRWV